MPVCLCVCVSREKGQRHIRILLVVKEKKCINGVPSHKVCVLLLFYVHMSTGISSGCCLIFFMISVDFCFRASTSSLSKSICGGAWVPKVVLLLEQKCRRPLAGSIPTPPYTLLYGLFIVSFCACMGSSNLVPLTP